jgi:anti-anti-sigma factor
VCWGYADRDEWRSVVVRFLADGLVLGERLVYAGTGHADTLIDDLAELSDLREMIAAGTLEVMTLHASTETPMTNGDQDGTCWLLRATATAVASGFSGLRVARDATELATADRAAEHQVGREVFLDRAVATRPVSMLCGYRIERVARLPLLAATHSQTNLPNGVVAAALVSADRGWALSGEIDLANREEIRTAVMAAAGLADSDLEIDCSGVAFLSVSGLEMLVGVAGSLDHGRRLVLHRPPPVVSRVLTMGLGTSVPTLLVD